MLSKIYCTLRALSKVCWRASLILLAGLLAGCQAIRPTQEGKLAVFSGRNLVGEDCRLQVGVSPEHPDQARREFLLYCGRWESPSARVYEAASRGDALDRWAKSGWWKEDLDRRVQCGKSEQSTFLDGAEALLLECTLRNGGWPYIALATRVNGTSYLADGIPAVFPVLEQAIGVLSGKRKPKAAGEAAAKSLALQKFEARFQARLFGAGDLRTYYQLMTAGQFYNSVKDFPTAANRYREALALHERLMGIDNAEALEPIMHLALELSNQERFTEAQVLFDRADVLAKQTLDRSDTARYFSYRALHAANQRQFAEALEFARKATALRRTLAAEVSVAVGDAGEAGQGAAVEGRADVAVLGNIRQTPTTVDIVQSLYLEAAMLERLGDVNQAQERLAEAAGILQNAAEAPPSWEPEVLGLSAHIAQMRGAQEQREQRLNTAASLWNDVAPGERPGAITYLKLGQAYRERGRLEDAMVAFRRGLKLIKGRGGSVGFEQLSPFFSVAYELAQSRPSQRSTLYGEMFEAGQLIRGGKTTQDIARAAARLGASEGAAGNIIRDLQEKQDERYVLYRAYEAEVAQGESEENRLQIEQLRKRITALNKTIEETSAQVQAAFPGYNQLMDTIADPAKVTRLIHPDEALVQVLLGARESLVFVVQGGRINAYPIAVSEQEIAGLVKELRAGLEPTPEGQLAPFDVTLAHQLYQKLFASVGKDLESARHLITVPTGPLLSLPFGLLVTVPPPAITGNDYSGVKWLARQKAISLLPSVRSFADLRETARASTAPKAFLGFGDFVPFTENALTQVDPSLPKECLVDPARVEKHRQLLLALGALPITQQEVDAVAATFPEALSERVFGARFNENAVRSGALDKYRVLYFATHGLLPAELECQPEPSLVASLSQPPGQNEDGLIEASEILKLRLDADLVVLSACNTGGPGLETGGESLSGLARAFFFAGARTLIVSHWPAEDETTAELMVRLFQRMRESPDTPLSDALRLAQLSVIDQAKGSGRALRSHPFLWGAFTVVGDGVKTASGF